MDRPTAIAGGFTILKEEALPSLATSTTPFAGAPAGTRGVLLTLRGAGATISFFGSTNAVVLGTNGHDYPASVNGPYEFTLSQSEAQKVRAIQNGGTATGWVSYVGVP